MSSARSGAEVSHHFVARKSWCQRRHSPQDQKESLVVLDDLSRQQVLERHQIWRQSLQLGTTDSQLAAEVTVTNQIVPL